MFNLVYATRFIKPMGNGRTKPCLLECENREGESVELVAKFSNECFEKEKNLVLEAFAAMLAADLKLPVPEPYLVKLEPEFIAIIENQEIREICANSCSFAFGSRYRSGMSAWPNGQIIPDHLCTEAAEVCVYDSIIINSDRIPRNPNCLFSGSEIAIFDHELTFYKHLGWQEPWSENALSELGMHDKHIFARPYQKKPILELDRFIAAWQDLPVDRFQQYKNALPREWLLDEVFVDSKIEYLVATKENIKNVVENALKAFK